MTNFEKVFREMIQEPDFMMLIDRVRNVYCEDKYMPYIDVLEWLLSEAEKAPIKASKLQEGTEIIISNTNDFSERDGYGKLLCVNKSGFWIYIEDRAYAYDYAWLEDGTPIINDYKESEVE